MSGKFDRRPDDWLAVEDACPQHLPRLLAGPLNPRGIGLEPARWESDGLFTPPDHALDPWPLVSSLRGRLGYGAAVSGTDLRRELAPL